MLKSDATTGSAIYLTPEISSEHRSTNASARHSKKNKHGHKAAPRRNRNGNGHTDEHTHSAHAHEAHTQEHTHHDAAHDINEQHDHEHGHADEHEESSDDPVPLRKKTETVPKRINLVLNPKVWEQVTKLAEARHESVTSVLRTGLGLALLAEEERARGGRMAIVHADGSISYILLPR